MKCPKCDHNTRLGKEQRTTCSNCNYKFLFNKSTDGTTDYRFNRVIERCSEAGAFTEEQWYRSYVAAWQKQNRSWGLYIIFLIIGIILALMFESLIPMIVAGVVIAVTPYFSKRWRRKCCSRDKFDDLRKRWMKHHKNPAPGLITGPSFKKEARQSENDLFDYGASSIVVVGRPEYVDLLVRSGWAGEQQALVICSDGYPQFLQDKCRQLLEEDEQLQVYLFHDCDNADSMRRQALDCDWLPVAEDRIHNVGASAALFSKHKPPGNDLEPASRIDALSPRVMGPVLAQAIIMGVALDMALSEVIRSNADISASFDADGYG